MGGLAIQRVRKAIAEELEDLDVDVGERFEDYYTAALELAFARQ